MSDAFVWMALLLAGPAVAHSDDSGSLPGVYAQESDVVHRVGETIAARENPSASSNACQGSQPCRAESGGPFDAWRLPEERRLFDADLATPKPRPSPEEAARIGASLRAMREEDQGLRQSWIEADTAARQHPERPDLKAEASKRAEQMSNHDLKDTWDLIPVLKKWGWPRISVFGAQADQDAWLIIQHSDSYSDQTIQEKALALMKQAVDAGDADRGRFAYLTDRVLVQEGKPQRFGTQSKGDPNSPCLTLDPIEDPSHVDERRKEYGLGPLEENMREVSRMYHMPFCR